MLILITYDVSTVEKAGPRRLRRVARACQDYGTCVQKSVFECQVGQKERVQLRARLLREIKADEDSLRFYFLDADAIKRTEHHGVDKPLDLTEPRRPSLRRGARIETVVPTDRPTGSPAHPPTRSPTARHQNALR